MFFVTFCEFEEIQILIGQKRLANDFLNTWLLTNNHWASIISAFNVNVTKRAMISINKCYQRINFGDFPLKIKFILNLIRMNGEKSRRINCYDGWPFHWNESAINRNNAYYYSCIEPKNKKKNPENNPLKTAKRDQINQIWLYTVSGAQYAMCLLKFLFLAIKICLTAPKHLHQICITNESFEFCLCSHSKRIKAHKVCTSNVQTVRNMISSILYSQWHLINSPFAYLHKA